MNAGNVIKRDCSKDEKQFQNDLLHVRREIRFNRETAYKALRVYFKT